ncbi:sulfite exporter TauE/SafE family protein [Corynebacterium ureicelerivorans]|uniref:sulfite exporter TauE/SafE family protein n=1 Tax=Corynebacterium ureicelerivorans TaxID=401472 RepID=UPI002652A399|nr:sulfite exporter TauE/SafE family protein [Corynebacterium ureicelerivorans]MDN8626840.1 sulfite exporter TauE/SafE family protein [Corynebacterium ureicelerivorans]
MLVAFGVGAAVAVGACLQRISGMGVGLIAAPVLSLLLGPVDGILLVNLLAVINAATNTWGMRADVDWQKFAPIALAMVLGVVPGAWVVANAPTDVLLILVGALLLLALSIVTLGKRYVPRVEGVLPAAVSGAVGGFMNTLAGVAGPAITVYAEAARWPQKVYAATLQPIFLVAGTLSFTVKVAAGAADVRGIEPALWVATLAALAVGIGAGKRLAPRVPSTTAHKIALGLAFAGGATALVRGLLA